MYCDQSDKSIAVGCHLIEGAICHLLRHCGDEAKRWATCKHEYTPSSTALVAAKSLVDIIFNSWQVSYLTGKFNAVVTAGLTLSAMMVSRYGPPRFSLRS